MTAHRDRILAMLAPGRQTWDLSPDDVAAIRWLSGAHDALLAAAEAVLAASETPAHLGGTGAQCRALNGLDAAVAKAKGTTR